MAKISTKDSGGGGGSGSDSGLAGIYVPGEGYGYLNQTTPPATGLLAAPRWQLPQFNAQFQYPQGLLDQLKAAQTPMQHGPPNYPRYNFGQGRGPAPALPQQQPQLGMNPALGGLLGQIAQLMQMQKRGQ